MCGQPTIICHKTNPDNEKLCGWFYMMMFIICLLTKNLKYLDINTEHWVIII